MDTQRLVYEYLHGKLSDQGFEHLRVWVLQDPEHACEFLRFVADDRAIERLMRQEDLGDLIHGLDLDLAQAQPVQLESLRQLEEEASPTLVDLTEQYELRRLQARHARQSKQGRVGKDENKPVMIVVPKALLWCTLAAAALVLAFVLWPGTDHSPDRVAVEPPSDPTQSVEPTPPTPTPPTVTNVAVLTGTARAVWAGDNAPRRGDALPAGRRYDLVAGLVQAQFDSGALVVVRAPAVFTFDSANQLSLERGQIVARCDSPRSKGFAVQTPCARITDLGTEFGVEHDASGTTRTQVFEGEIQLQPIAAEPHIQPMQLHRGQAASVDAHTACAQPIPFAPDRQSGDWEQLIRQPTITGNARYIYSPPASLELNAFEDDTSMIMMMERMDHVLTQDVTLTISDPGQYDTFDAKHWRTLQAGTSVDTYLLHFDPVSGANGIKSCVAEIRLDRPIIGVIANGRHITNSDRELGHASTRYGSDYRPIERRDARSVERTTDMIKISPDRRVLIVKFQVSTSLDQLRILVEPRTQS